MWLDDDGDEPIGGEVPDPSTRHWRHPSEVAAEAAAFAAAAAAPIVPEGATAGVVTSAHGGPSASSASILWPITVVGGCIAVAALGVVGLYLTGAADVEELQVASATTISPNVSDLSARARAQSAAPDNRTYTDDGEESPDPDRLEGLGLDQSPLPSPTTTLATSSTTSTTALASTTTTAAAMAPQRMTRLVGPAIYPSDDPAAEQLASVILADGYLLTSASAMAGRTDVSLRIGDMWIDTAVSHVDLLSDVAVLTPLDTTVQLPMPISVLGPSVKTGINVFLGYCPSEMASPPVELDRQKQDPDSAQEWGSTASEPGCTPIVQNLPQASESQAERPDAEASGPQDQDKNQDEDQAPNEEEPVTGGGAADEESTETVPETIPADPSERKGKIYSLDQTLRTMAGRILYEPIRTGIPQEPPVAGSPLRDHQGRVVGLVVAASSPNVSAVPIDRAITVAKSMVDTGLASPAWIGIDVISTSSGVEVVGVEIGGPADGKLVMGDLIDRVNGDVVIESDHLEHLTREAGPGKALVVRFLRDGERQQAAVRIGSKTLDTE